jgi:hypothetical protein
MPDLDRKLARKSFAEVRLDESREALVEALPRLLPAASLTPAGADGG